MQLFSLSKIGPTPTTSKCLHWKTAPSCVKTERDMHHQRQHTSNYVVLCSEATLSSIFLEGVQANAYLVCSLRMTFHHWSQLNEIKMLKYNSLCL